MKQIIGFLICSIVVLELVSSTNAACANREKNEDERIGEFIEDVKCHLSTGTEKIKDGASRAGTSIKEGASRAGESIKDGAVKVYDVLKSGVSKAADVVSSGYNYLKKAVQPSKSDAVQDVEDTKPIWDVLPIMGDVKEVPKDLKA